MEVIMEFISEKGFTISRG